MLTFVPRVDGVADEGVNVGGRAPHADQFRLPNVVESSAVQANAKRDERRGSPAREAPKNQGNCPNNLNNFCTNKTDFTAALRPRLKSLASVGYTVCIQSAREVWMTCVLDAILQKPDFSEL